MKTAEEKILLTLVATAFIGFAGVKPLFGDDQDPSSKTEMQKMEIKKTAAKKSMKDADQKIKNEKCEVKNGRMECETKTDSTEK